jgi:hypothetical protein
MSVAAALILMLTAPVRAGSEPAECPAGTHRIATDNPYEPFKCVTADDDKKKGFDAVVGPKGFSSRPRCPHGTRAVASPEGSLQPYRCVRATAGDTDPELTPLRGDDDAPPPDATQVEEDPMTRGCAPGRRKVRTTDPLHPYQCVVQASRSHTIEEGSFTRYSISHELSFEYPRQFRVRDAWKEDVPTLYLKLDDNAAGKPVTITITRYEQSQSTFQEMDAAIARDIEWQGAKDGGVAPLAGGPSRSTYVPGDSRSVYLPTSKQSYYAFVYSASADAYENYLPAFNRLLKTLRLDRTGQ